MSPACGTTRSQPPCGAELFGLLEEGKLKLDGRQLLAGGHPSAGLKAGVMAETADRLQRIIEDEHGVDTAGLEHGQDDLHDADLEQASHVA